MTRQKIVSCLVFLVMNKYLDFMLFILPTPLIIKPWNHHFLGQNSTVIGYWWPYYQIFQLPHCSQVTAHRSPLIAHRSQYSTPLMQTWSIFGTLCKLVTAAHIHAPIVFRTWIKLVEHHKCLYSHINMPDINNIKLRHRIDAYRT
jgi:hypothetical protein